MTYADRLNAFASRFQKLDDALIHEYSREGKYSVSRCIEVTDGRRACQCCGNKRLKVLWPAVPDGDPSRVLWIGSECFKNLREMGKLEEFSHFTVEVHL